LSPLVFGEIADQRQARIDRLKHAVLAPCCYAEPVAIHQSEIPVKMRLEIAECVAAGNVWRGPSHKIPLKISVTFYLMRTSV
jgi:hypothetical protein